MDDYQFCNLIIGFNHKINIYYERKLSFGGWEGGQVSKRDEHKWSSTS